MSIADSIERVVKHVLDKLENLRVDTVRPNGNNRLRIHHPSGSSIEFDSKGNLYIDGVKVYINGEEGGALTVEDDGTELLTTPNINFGDGLSVSMDGDGSITVNATAEGSVSNPLTDNLDASGNVILDSQGLLTFRSSDGQFKFEKS